MRARWLHLPLLFCALWLSLGTADAQQTLYGATAGDTGGNLYIIDPTNAAATLVGPILVGGLQVGVTGLAFHPLTGVLYAVTDHKNVNYPDYLITIDRTSGAATLIGPLGQILTDISFDSTGMLYGWIGQPSGDHLVSINLSTGAATVFVPSPPGPYVNDGGLAFSPGGILYVVNNNTSVFPTQAILRIVDKITGTTTDGPVIPASDRDINALAFNAAGILFASSVDSDTFSILWIIDTTTGAITEIGQLPFDPTIRFGEHTDAIAFTPAAPSFLIRYFSNLNIADSLIDITNTGVEGSVCANIYAFAADEQEVSCCSCLVTPNGLNSLSVNGALQNSVLTSSVPPELVVKLIATAPASSTDPSTGLITQTCNPATTTAFGAGGLLAWGATPHGFPAATGPNFQLTETPFLPGTLSLAELQRDVQECQFIQILGSGQFGLCKGCQNAGLGAAQQ